MDRRNYTQANRMMAVTSPFGQDALLIRSLSGTESISSLYVYQLELVSEDDSLNFADIVGKQVGVRIELADETHRYWNGVVSRFSQGGRDHNVVSYHAELVPWLWFLTRTADCRIFQKKKTPEIVQAIFKDLGLDQFEFRLYRTYQPRDYCVQYRETDFNFVSRLMEDEGMFYYFEHDESSHKLIVSDDCSVHKPCPNQSMARYELDDGGWREEDRVQSWSKVQELRPGKWAQTDYNFESPATDLMVTVSGANPYEVYDYPGEYAQRFDGTERAKVRLQEETAPTVVISGSSNCRDFRSGWVFDLEDHYRADQNAQYLLTSVSHSARQSAEYESGGAAIEYSYSNSFTCIPAEVPYRPSRVTRKPRVQGCQTAMVVGPSGEEIYTDTYGRVKVQFHWDREGKRNENSSCWVRVATTWAGKSWGSISIPRIGQEVVVDFLEGDPDRPIIVGSVYNAECMPPYTLPDAAYNMGFKSKSIKGGGYNEISINDSNAAEGITIHAQYDMQTRVENDDTIWIGKNREEYVGVDEKITIGSNRTEEVGADETIKIAGNRIQIVDSSKQTTVADAYTIKCDTMLIDAATSITLKSGASSIHMNQAGLIEIKGNILTIVATVLSSLTAPITSVTGGIALTLNGALFNVLSGVTNIYARAQARIKSAMVKINC